MPRSLNAREYKLLLNPSAFQNLLDRPAAKAFYRDRIEPIVNALDGLEAEGGFGAPQPRDIRFYETADRVLKRSGYALRRRKSDGTAEVTLKLRLPDLFVVAATALPGSEGDARTKFEEDIAPLEVAKPGGGVTVADPPSIRSRFALSTKQTTGLKLKTLSDAFELYPTLKDNLERSNLGFSDPGPVRKGPLIRETVFEGPRIRLDGEATAELALTWWDFVEPAAVASVAEISYQVETEDGELSGKAARRAYDLFVAMQTGLKDHLDLDHPSKTALALPK